MNTGDVISKHRMNSKRHCCCIFASPVARWGGWLLVRSSRKCITAGRTFFKSFYGPFLCSSIGYLRVSVAQECTDLDSWLTVLSEVLHGILESWWWRCIFQLHWVWVFSDTGAKTLVLTPVSVHKCCLNWKKEHKMTVDNIDGCWAAAFLL